MRAGESEAAQLFKAKPPPISSRRPASIPNDSKDIQGDPVTRNRMFELTHGLKTLRRVAQCLSRRRFEIGFAGRQFHVGEFP